MPKVAMEAGMAVAVYVDDGQGRRIVIGTLGRDRKMMEHPVVLGTTRAQIRHVISALRNLMEELPREEPTVTPPPEGTAMQPTRPSQEP